MYILAVAVQNLEAEKSLYNSVGGLPSLVLIGVIAVLGLVLWWMFEKRR
jgi:hypothetical protein